MGGDGVLGDGFEELGRILGGGGNDAGGWVNGRFDARYRWGKRSLDVVG